jgi:DNA (cytosine-5)-methyltransferase 1
MKSRDYKDATDLVAFHVNAMPDQMNFNSETTASLTTSQYAGVAQSVTYSIMPMNSGKDYKAREVNVAQPVLAGGPSGGNQGGHYIM